MDLQEKLFAARDIKTPAKILKQLSKDSDIQVRRAVANNVCSPPYVLDFLAKAEDEDWLLFYITVNPNASTQTLSYIFDNLTKHYWVRYNLSRHTNTSKEIILYLLTDENEDVRRHAQDSLKRWLDKNA